jgi:hypothetical protein
MSEQCGLAVAVELRQRVPKAGRRLRQLLGPLLMPRSIALAEAVSAKPGACAEKPECFAVISKQVPEAYR